MGRRISYTLMYGNINKDLRVDMIYTFDDDAESKYKTLKFNPEKNSTYIRPSYALSITEGFDKPRMFIPGSQISLVEDVISKTVKAVSEHLFELFPDIGKKNDYDINISALEKFTIENAVDIGGYTAIPCTYATPESECKPAIRLNSPRGESVRLPLTDAIVISKKLEKTDLDTLSLLLLNVKS